MNEETIIHVIWEGPLSLNDVTALQDATRDRGVYAIYGPHNVYGQSALLYIGKAERPFGLRIPEHGWRDFERASEIQIYVGRFTLPPDQVSKHIASVESLLIYAHGPAYNSSSVQDPPHDSPLRVLRILNWRSYRAMLPEVSGLRWLTPHKLI